MIFLILILSGYSLLEELKGMPAPEVAVKYYTGADLYLFGKSDLFTTYSSII